MATIKEINHDSSTTLADFYNDIFDADGAFTVTPTAALNGTTNGLAFDFDAGSATGDLYEPFSAALSTNDIRWRIYLKLDDLTYSDGSSDSTVTIRWEISDVTPIGSGSVFQLNLYGKAGGSFAIEAIYVDDSNNTNIVGGTDFAIPSTGEVCIEIRAVRESSASGADGEVELFVDGVSKASDTTAENFTRWTTADGYHIRIQSSDADFTGDLYSDEFLTTDDSTTSLCAAVSVLGLAPMTKPMSIDASGDFIYLALLDNGTPILTKISTVLSTDGTTIFDPGSGDNIGVECSQFNADIVWIAGQFDGTNVVEKSENAGSTFDVKDDATIGGIRTFVVGPDSDQRLLVYDEDNSDILETINDGTDWDTINDSITKDINDIARLGINVQEVVFGNQGAAADMFDAIQYSVNSGDDLEGYKTGVYPADTNATKVIVN